MVGNILNHFYNDGTVDNAEIAKIAQYSENVFFGKPCGLMDQMRVRSVDSSLSILPMQKILW